VLVWVVLHSRPDATQLVLDSLQTLLLMALEKDTNTKYKYKYKYTSFPGIKQNDHDAAAYFS